MSVAVPFQLWTWGQGGMLNSLVPGMVLYFAKTGIRKQGGKKYNHKGKHMSTPKTDTRPYDHPT